MSDDERLPLALEIQLLGTSNEQVLVLAYLVGLRSGQRSFAPMDVLDLCGILRLPTFANVNVNLARLKELGLVVSQGRGQWAVSPLGERRARNLIRDLDPARVEAETAGVSGALFADVEHKVLPPEFAPVRWKEGIERMLERFPFETNVFCMTRFPADDDAVPDPVARVIDVARDELQRHGLTLHLASDRQFEDDLLGNVGAYMWACKYGLGLLEARVDARLNYNAVIELGSMIVMGRRCTMLKDLTAPNLPTDLSGQIYKSLDFENLDDAQDAVRHWVVEDLGIGS